MRISLLKNSIDDPDLRVFISRAIWGNETCKAALSAASDEEHDINTVYSIVVSALLADIECTNASTEEGKSRIKANRKLLDGFSKLLYGYRGYWTKGTVYEQDYLEKEQLKAARKANRQQLQCLYERFNIEKRKRNDIIQLLTSDIELSTAILERKDEIQTRGDLYSVVEPILLARIRSNCFKQKDIVIAEVLSSFCSRNRNTLFERNGLEPIMIKTVERSHDNNSESESTEAI